MPCASILRHSISASVLLAGSSTLAQTWHAPIFPRQIIRTCTASGAIRVADLNADGLPDIIEHCGVEDSIRIFLRRPQGDFEPQIPVSRPGPDPIANSRYAVADLNGDGHVDIAAASVLLDEIHVLFGDGTGSFQFAPFVIPCPGAPAQVVLEDMDGDGDADYIAANSEGESVRIIPNNGDGTPGAPIFQAGAEIRPSSIVASDFDGDGRPDIALAGSSVGPRRITVFCGTEAGLALSLGPQLDSPEDIRQIVAADADGDGDTDIIASCLRETRVLLYRNDGAATFSPAETIFELSSQYSAAIDSAHYNDDDAADIVLGLRDDKRSGTILLSDGLGGFSAVTAFEELSVDQVYAVDMNGDGAVDIVSETAFVDRIIIHYNDGALGFPSEIGIGEGIDLTRATLADIDADGVEELLAISTSDESVYIARQTPDGFLMIDAADVPMRDIRTLVASDIDADGNLDLVATDGDDELSWRLNNGDGTFASRQTMEIEGDSWGVVPLDIDDDGLPDLAITRTSNFQQIQIVGNLGAGVFAPPTFFNTEDNPEDLAVADFDRDGLEDLLVLHGGSVQLASIHYKLPGGAYSPPSSWPTGSAVGDRGLDGLEIADMNGDGYPDVVLGGTSSLAILYNDGAGRLPLRLKVDSGFFFGDVKVTDMNLDGRPDIVATSDTGPFIGVYFQQPEPFSFRGQFYTGPDNPWGLAVLDLDEDCFPDLAVTGRLDGASLTMYHNIGVSDCPASFAPPCDILDFSDVLGFLAEFAEGTRRADRAAPFGVLDFSDVLLFITSFGGGCP